MDDIDLLREYATSHSEAAFTTLVERHLGLIYSAALRRVRDPGLAEEVTQIVCIAMARKAHTLTRWSNLSGWLYQATRFAAAEAVRSQLHRQKREQEAAEMQANCNDDSAWQSLAPILDQAMDDLREKDREAVILRFFENKSLEGVGSALGISEQAAKKRVTRAVEKPKSCLSRRGTLLSAVALGSLLSANSVQAMPVGLATALTATALKGIVVGGSTPALLHRTLKAMGWAKVKFAIGLGTALSIAAGGIAIVLLAGTPSSSDAVSGVVHLEGTSTRHIFDAQGNEIAIDLKDEQGNILRHGDSTHFSLWQSGCRWKIRFDYGPTLAGKVLSGSVSEIACDGTNIYSFVPGAGGTWEVGSKIERYEDSGSVWPGSLKILRSHTAPIWWAYCSGCNIAQEGPVPDFGEWGSSSADEHISSELNLRQAAPEGVTSRVGPLEAALYREAEAGKLDTIPTAEIKPMETPTNSGTVFVTKFQVNRYRDSRTMKLPGGPPELLERFDVVIDEFGVEKSRISLVPKMTRRTFVSDYRLPRVGHYLTSNWVDIEAAQRNIETANRMRRQRAAMTERSKIHAGEKAPSFQSNDTTSKLVTFPEDYKGKLVLLDFWATWCGPCVGEMPHLTAAYEKLHAQGFEVLGVSLDDTKAAEKLARFCHAHSMSWPQIHDGKAWESEVAKRYRVESIPSAFLVDGDTGLVLSEGEELQAKRLLPTLEKALARKNSK